MRFWKKKGTDESVLTNWFFVVLKLLEKRGVLDGSGKLKERQKRFLLLTLVWAFSFGSSVCVASSSGNERYDSSGRTLVASSEGKSSPRSFFSASGSKCEIRKLGIWSLLIVFVSGARFGDSRGRICDVVSSGC